MNINRTTSLCSLISSLKCIDCKTYNNDCKDTGHKNRIENSEEAHYNNSPVIKRTKIMTTMTLCHCICYSSGEWDKQVRVSLYDVKTQSCRTSLNCPRTVNTMGLHTYTMQHYVRVYITVQLSNTIKPGMVPGHMYLCNLKPCWQWVALNL